MKKCLLLFNLLLIANLAKAHPCENPSILDLTDRGTVTDTPCTVPSQQLLIEGGYAYFHLIDQAALQFFPQLQINWGLPLHNEISIYLPNYFVAKHPTIRGYAPPTLEFKHEFWYGKNWIISGESFLTLPGGSAFFGYAGPGINLNAIVGYKLLPHWVFTVVAGYSSLTNPSVLGGQRFNSFNPSVVLSFEANEKMTWFIESYAETQSTYTAGGGIVLDAGLFYAIRNNFAIDVEWGHQVQGYIVGMKSFVNLGVTLLL